MGKRHPDFAQGRDRATWSAPGTCGELVQGFHRDRWLHVAAPVNRRRIAAVDTSEPPVESPPSVTTDPEAWWKARRGLQEVLAGRVASDGLAVAVGGDEIPRGVGLGSSTADLGAVVAAAAARLGVPDPAATAVDIALRVEPTNGALLPGLALFDHRAGTVREFLGSPPPLEILAFDSARQVDTLAFNRRLPSRLPAEALQGWAAVFRLCAEGVWKGDAEAVAQAATRSASLAVYLGCSAVPAALLRLVDETSALGVARAHSGSAYGVLYAPGTRPSPEEVSEKIRWDRDESGRAARVEELSLSDGGIWNVGPLPFEPEAVIVAPRSEGADGSPV